MKIGLLAAVLGGLCGCNGKLPDSDDDKTYQDEEAGFRQDAVALDPQYAEVFAEIDAEVEAALKDHPRKGKIGFVHIVWAKKKEILKEKYGIEWRSPSELNPQIMFD